MHLTQQLWPTQAIHQATFDKYSYSLDPSEQLSLAMMAIHKRIPSKYQVLREFIREFLAIITIYQAI
jgi:hypothetical protein